MLKSGFLGCPFFHESNIWPFLFVPYQYLCLCLSTESDYNNVSCRQDLCRPTNEKQVMGASTYAPLPLPRPGTEKREMFAVAAFSLAFPSSPMEAQETLPNPFVPIHSTRFALNSGNNFYANTGKLCKKPRHFNYSFIWHGKSFLIKSWRDFTTFCRLCQ